MPIPDVQSITLPLLKLAGDGGTHLLRDAVDRLAQHFRLTEPEQRELMPNGRQRKFHYNVGWARTYLRKAVLLDIPRTGEIRITERGQSVLASKPPKIDREFLCRFDEFLVFIGRRPTSAGTSKRPEHDTPEQILRATHQTLRRSLADDLLDRIKQSSPEFFERLVVDVLVRMGYGGSIEEAGEAVGQTGDGGIDGIIKEDPLGLDVIYVQAKRYGKATVGAPELRDFSGALDGKNATKGVFITTSSFTSAATSYVSGGLRNKVIRLISGTELAELMIDHDIAVTTEATYAVKRIDADYFPTSDSE